MSYLKTLTGSEPVDGGEVVVEPAETGSTNSDPNAVTINFTSGNIIKAVKYQFVEADGSTPVGPEMAFDSLSVNSGKVTLVSTDAVTGAEKIKITDVELTGEDIAADGQFLITVSGNAYTGLQKKAKTAAEIAGNIVGFNDIEIGNEKDLDIVAKKTVYDATLNLDILSSDIIKKVKILSINADANGDDETPVAYDEYGTKSEAIIFHNIRGLVLSIPDNAANILQNGVIKHVADYSDPQADEAFTLSYNGAGEIGGDKVTKKVNYTLDDNVVISLENDGPVSASFSADLRADYNKKGTVTLKVLSQNDLGNGKILSIDNITAQLLDYAIEWDGSDFDVATYRSTVSGGNIKTNEKGLVKDDQGYYNIVIPYEYAKNFEVVVTDTYTDGRINGNNEKHTKYAYTLDGGKTVFYDAKATGSGDKAAVVELPKQLTANATYTLGIKQMNYDPEAAFEIVSADIIDYVDFTIVDSAGNTKAEKVKVDKTGNFTFEDASKIKFRPKSDIDDYKKLAPAGGYVYRIEYTDLKTQKAVNKSFEADDDSFYEIDVVNGNLPSPIKISAVPNVKVILSANGTNRSKDKQFTGFSWRDEGGHSGSATWDASNKFGYFYAERDKVVSVNTLVPYSGYVFPYVVGKEANKELTEWTLGALTEDENAFDVDTYEFGVDIAKGNNVVVIDKKSSTSDSVGAVSINNIDGAVATVPAADKSTLSDNKVFTVTGGYDLEVTFKLDNTASKDYKFNTISYEKYGSGLTKTETVTLKEGTDFIQSGLLTDSEGNTYRTATINIPNDDVKNMLLRQQTFKINVAEFDNDREYELSVKAKANNTIGSVKFYSNDASYWTVDAPTTTASTKNVAYGTPLSIKVAPKPGFKLVSVNIIEMVDNDETESQNSITNITDAKTIAEFTGNGYSGTKQKPLKMGKNTVIYFTADKSYNLDVTYKSGDPTVATDKSGKYLVNHQRKLRFEYTNGTDHPACTYVVLAGSKDVTSALSGNALKKDGNYIELDPSNEELVGKNVTVKFYTGDGSKTDESLRTAVLIVDSAKTGIKFAKDAETVTLGTTASFKATVVGNPVISVVVSPDLTPADKAGAVWDASKKTLTFTTTKDSSAKASTEYTVKLLDKGDPTLPAYATLKVTATTDAVKNAPAPAVTLAGKSNRGVTLNLASSKIDTKIDGLMYKVTVSVKAGTQKKQYFSTTPVVKYVPITDKSVYVDMAAAKMDEGDNKYDGDPDAVFIYTASLVQRNSTPKDIVESKASDPQEVSPMKGEQFETKLKLTKGSKGSIYTNMDSSNGYRINVVYSKNTAVQRIQKYALYNSAGAELNTNDYVDKESEYTLVFHPADNTVGAYANTGDQLAPGTYTLKVWAAEPLAIDVTASIKLKVVPANVVLAIDNAPTTIYKPVGKVGKAEIIAFSTGYDTKGHVNTAKAKKVEYSIVQKKIAGAWDAPGQAEVVPAFVTSKMVTINKNNGKITVKKDFVVDENSKFYVKVISKDYATTKCDPKYTEEITIKTTAESNYALAFASPAGWFDDTAINKLGASYKANELFYKGAPGSEYEYYTYITMYEQAKTAGASAVYIPADYKVSGAGKLLGIIKGQDFNGNSLIYARIALNKLGDIKITATATDGSERVFKGKTAKVVKVTNEGKLGYQFFVKKNDTLTALDNAAIDADAGKIVSVNNYAAEGDTLVLKVQSYYQKADDSYVSTYVSNTVSAKSGCKVTKAHKNGAYDDYYIVPNDRESTIIITDTTTKPKTKYEIKITNYAIGTKTSKAVVTATGGTNGKGAIYSSLNYANAAADGLSTYDKVSTNKVTYAFTKNGVTDGYALVSVVKDDKNSTINESLKNRCTNDATNAKKVDDNTYAIKVTGGKFFIDYTTSGFLAADDSFDLAPGTYKISITPAEEKDGKYIAKGKAAVVSVSAKKAPKANVKVNSTIKDFNTSTKIGNIVITANAKTYNAAAKVQFIGLLKNNNKGSLNKFTDNFTIPKADETKLQYKGSADITSLDASELIGHVKIRYQNLDGTTAEPTFKVTVKVPKAK